MIPVNPSKIVGEVPKSVHLTWTNVGIGLLFLLLDATLSVFLELGLSMSIITAAIRCVVQLSLMVSFGGSNLDFFRISRTDVGKRVIPHLQGLVLQKVFESDNPWAVAGITCEPITWLLDTMPEWL
jgi:hypothetical protein